MPNCFWTHKQEAHKEAGLSNGCGSLRLPQISVELNNTWKSFFLYKLEKLLGLRRRAQACPVWHHCVDKQAFIVFCVEKDAVGARNMRISLTLSQPPRSPVKVEAETKGGIEENWMD